MRREQLELDYSYLRQMLSFAEEIENTLDKVKHYGIDLYDEMVVASLAMHIGQIGEQLDSRKLSKEDMKLNPKNPVVRSHEKIHGFFLLYKNNRKVEQ